jgi:hypothetical protein
MLFPSAAKIIVAEKADRLDHLHLECDCNGGGWMCQAMGIGIGRYWMCYYVCDRSGEEKIMELNGMSDFIVLSNGWI